MPAVDPLGCLEQGGQVQVEVADQFLAYRVSVPDFEVQLLGLVLVHLQVDLTTGQPFWVQILLHHLGEVLIRRLGRGEELYKRVAKAIIVHRQQLLAPEDMYDQQALLEVRQSRHGSKKRGRRRDFLVRGVLESE